MCTKSSLMGALYVPLPSKTTQMWKSILTPLIATPMLPELKLSLERIFQRSKVKIQKTLMTVAMSKLGLDILEDSVAKEVSNNNKS